MKNGDIRRRGCAYCVVGHNDAIRRGIGGTRHGCGRNRQLHDDELRWNWFRRGRYHGNVGRVQECGLTLALGCSTYTCLLHHGARMGHMAELDHTGFCGVYILSSYPTFEIRYVVERNSR